jgi:hypothetical protein
MPTPTTDQSVPPRHSRDFTRAAELTSEVMLDIEQCMNYQPWDEGQRSQGAVVRHAAINLVKAIVASAPPGPDRSSAIRHVRMAMMEANSAITHHGRF